MMRQCIIDIDAILCKERRMKVHVHALSPFVRWPPCPREAEILKKDSDLPLETGGMPCPEFKATKFEPMPYSMDIHKLFPEGL